MPVANSATGQAARCGKTFCCRRYTPMAKKNSPLTKKFFICRGMLAKTKTQAVTGSVHSKTRASNGDLASIPNSNSDVMTCPGITKRKLLPTECNCVDHVQI